MKRVLVIAPDFAPSSYPPAQRVRFFASHLPEFGWEPIVLTVRPQEYAWSVDPENEKLLPESLQVIRTPAVPLRLTRRLGIGDIGIRSMLYHWRAVSELYGRSRVELVFIPLPPFFSSILGRLIYEKFKVPYVIDYMDPWITNSWRKYPDTRSLLKRRLSAAISLVLEPFALRHASHIIGVSKGTTDGVLCRYPWLTETDATEIPLGGEPADFEYLYRNSRKNSIFNRNDGYLHFSYVGVCNSAMQATLVALLKAVGMGLERTPKVFNRIRLHFVGTTYAPNAESVYQVLPLVREMGLEGIVDEHPGRVSYLDSLQLLLDSHALLVVGSNAPHYTASKIFPYILARKPLLAIFHAASSVVKILQETGAGHVITFSEQCPPESRVEEISKYLEGMLSHSSDYQAPMQWETFEPYTTRAMTARLAMVFDKVLLRNAPPQNR